MRKMKKLIIVFLLIVAIVCLYPPASAVNDTTSSQTVAVKSYEFDSGDAYRMDKATPVNSMSFGRMAVGTLNVSGTILENKSYAGKKAFGVAGNVTFSYTYDSRLLNNDENRWHIVDDKEKKVNGIKLDSNILSGALIVQKSYDGVVYENAVNPVLDFFNAKTSGVKLYSTSGADISRGVFLRFILAYKTEKAKDIIHWYTLPWARTESHRNMEVYDFYVVEDSGTISIHNLSNAEEILHEDEYTQELLKHGETLVNNSVTRDGFSIEKITSSYRISVSRNGETAKSAENLATFTEDGKYDITVTTKLGRKVTTTIYVFGGGEDKGFSNYFGTGLVQAERVFRYNKYPTYARGGQIAVNEVDENTPILMGALTNLSSGDVVFELAGTREAQTFPLEPGMYTADFYTGNPDDAGSIYHYSFIFSVLDEESAPYVNHNKLLQTDRLEDLQTKHYEVAYQTAGGGYIYVCFSMDSYDDALMYAREIEGRFVEPSADGGFYYKSEENPNRKVKYYDEIELTRVREIYAFRNVEINYFNATDAFTYKTYDDDLLEALESLSISESIKVFPSKAEKEKFFDRTPYINNFTFIQATQYDVVKVEAKCDANEKIYELDFGKPVSEQLSVSSLYQITETNSYGRITTYEAYYVADCQTTMTWTVTKDGEEITIPVSHADDGLVIEADSAFVSAIENDVDKWAIVTIKAPGVYSFEIKCLATEFRNLEFIKPGIYEISFVDRLGNNYGIELHISGKLSLEEKKPFTVSYATFYNNLYLNQKDTKEDESSLSELPAQDEESFNLEVYESSTPPSDIPSITSTSEHVASSSTNERINSKPIMVIVSGVIFLSFVAILIFTARKKNAAKPKDEIARENIANAEYAENTDTVPKENNEQD